MVPAPRSRMLEDTQPVPPQATHAHSHSREMTPCEAVHEYTEKHTHTQQHQMENTAWAGPGSHYSLTHTEGLVELRKQAVKWGGGSNLLTSPARGTSCSLGCMHPLPALRGSRSLSSASAQPRGDPGSC